MKTKRDKEGQSLPLDSSKKVGTYVFGILIFLAIVAVIFFASGVDPQDKSQLVRILGSTFVGLVGLFFSGHAAIKGNLPGWKKASVTAGGGAALFLIVFYSWKHSSRPVETLKVTVDGYAIYEKEGIPDFQGFPMRKADGAVAAAADWLSEAVHERCAQEVGDVTYHIEYQPDKYTNQIVYKEVRVKVFNKVIKKKTPEKKRVFALPRSITIEPNDGKLSIYPWLVSSTGTRKDHPSMENAIEYFQSAKKPIYLQLVRPGYTSKLVLLDPNVKFSADVILEKRDYVVVLSDIGNSPVEGQLAANLTSKPGFRVFGADRLDALRDFMGRPHELKNKDDFLAKIAGFRERQIDFVVNLGVEAK